MDRRVEIAAAVRRERPRALASLIRVLGDFDRAEEALQEALLAAVERWPVEGVPDNARAWLVHVARNRAVDRLRHLSMRRGKQDALVTHLSAAPVPTPEELLPEGSLVDDQLRLVFTCCHPALPPDAQVALTLRTVCGLSTQDLARAFLVPGPTMAQRLVRAKRRLRDEAVAYRVPDDAELPSRLGTVLAVLYLVFNEGYSATSGEDLVREELTAEAIRLARLVDELLAARVEDAARSEVVGLLALMLLHDARRRTRTDADGRIVLLEDQDRSRWDRARIDEGRALVRRALRMGPPGPYALQAAIAACHAEAPTAADTDWPQILALYRVLGRVLPTPVVRLNGAVALAMVAGPEAGLREIDALRDEGSLAGYHLLHAARADLLRRLGRRAEARDAYLAALEVVGHDAERQFLQGRLAEVTAAGP